MKMKNYIKTDDKSSVDVSLEVQLIKDGNYIVSYCPALELSSYGKDEEDAKEGFEEALSIFLEELKQRGTLEKVLLNLGWGLRKLPFVSFQPPEPESLKPYSKPVQKRFNEKVAIPVY